MKKLHIGIVVAALGLMLCSAASTQAVELKGTVYFDAAETIPAPCSWVQVYSSSGCDDDLVDSQVADENGEYSFDLGGGQTYWVIARWAIVFCTHCDPVGDDCETRFDSDCESVYLSGTETVDLSYGDIDCYCQ